MIYKLKHKTGKPICLMGLLTFCFLTPLRDARLKNYYQWNANNSCFYFLHGRRRRNARTNDVPHWLKMKDKAVHQTNNYMSHVECRLLNSVFDVFILHETLIHCEGKLPPQTLYPARTDRCPSLNWISSRILHVETQAYCSWGWTISGWFLFEANCILKFFQHIQMYL